MLNPLAQELNDIIQKNNQTVYEMLSELGKKLYYPKGILTQSDEAKSKATKYNATIGISVENKKPMFLNSVMSQFNGLSSSDVLSYAPTFGKQELRKKWQDEIYAKNPSLTGKKISMPIVTCGVTHGLSVTGDFFVNKDDAVLIPDQVWGNYNYIFGIRLNAKMVKYPFFSDKGGLDLEGLKNVISKNSGAKKIILLLNFPNNPTGYSITKTEATELKNILVSFANNGINIVTLCDDAYFGLFYEEDVLKESIFSLLANAHERILAIKLDGATKEDFVWGFRTGFITFSTKNDSPEFYEAMEKKTGGSIRGNISNCPHVSQSVLLKAFTSKEYAKEKAEKFIVLKERALKVKEILSNKKFNSTWTPYSFNSGYFMCVKMKNVKAEDYRKELLNKYGIGTIATAEYDIRVAFSSVEKADLQDLFDLMLECAIKMKA